MANLIRRSRTVAGVPGAPGGGWIEPDYTVDRLLVGLGSGRRTGVNTGVFMPEGKSAQTVTTPPLITA